MIPAFTSSLAMFGCGGSSPGADPDAEPVIDEGPPAPPPDAGDGGVCSNETQECVDMGSDVYVPPDTDGPVTRPDAEPDLGLDGGRPDAEPDGEPDLGPDAGTPGVDPCLFEFTGPPKVLKNDPTTPSNVWAFTGPDTAGTDNKPLKLWLCTPASSGLNCSVKADFTDPAHPTRSIFTAGNLPVDFAPVADNGFGFAVAAPESGSPTTVVRVDQNAATFAGAVPSSRYHTSFGAWGDYEATHPSAMIAYPASFPSPPHIRSALTFAEITVGIFVEDVNFSGEVINPLRRSSSVPGLSDGINSSSIAITRLMIDGEETDALIVLNSGATDLTTGASISYLDPWSTKFVMPLSDPASLGSTHAAVLKLNEDGTTAYIAFDGPRNQLVHYDLEAQSAITTILLGGAVAGDITTMDISPSRACVGDTSGRLVFVNLDEGTTEGYMEWPELPESILWHGGRETFLVSNGNCMAEANPPAEALVRP